MRRRRRAGRERVGSRARSRRAARRAGRGEGWKVFCGGLGARDDSPILRDRLCLRGW